MEEYAKRLSKIMVDYQYQRLTLRRINERLNKTRPRLKQLSNCWVRKILREHLDYRWKRCSKRNRRITQHDYIEEKKIWCRFLILAFHSSLRVIAIDEFAIDDTNVQNYKWCKKNKEAYTLTYPRKKKLNCIIAHDSSELLFTSIQAETIKSSDFLEFIEDLLEDLRKDGEDLENVMLFIDNATPHRSKEIYETMRRKKLRCIMNQSYSPELNPAELIIRAIKTKMKADEFV